MNTEKKFEQFLRAAPKPPIPDGLLDKLQAGISAGDIKTQRSALRRWFAPYGSSISPWRVATAVAIAILVLLPLSYGATKVIKHYYIALKDAFVIFEDPEDNVGYGYGSGIVTDDPNFTEEDARKALEEFYKLYKEGKAKEVKPGVWSATLSNGERFNYGGDPELLGLSEAERREAFKKQFDEINELRKAGKYERTFIEEIEKDGVAINLYKDTFTLSNGKVVTLTTGEEK